MRRENTIARRRAQRVSSLTLGHGGHGNTFDRGRAAAHDTGYGGAAAGGARLSEAALVGQRLVGRRVSQEAAADAVGRCAAFS